MTKLERKRFWAFWKKHPFAYTVEEIGLGNVGYALLAVSLNGKVKEEITDYDWMLSHI